MLLKRIDDRQADMDALRSLLGRRDLSPRCRHDVQAELDNIRVGAAGEHDAAYFIDFEFASHKHIAIIHDLRLAVSGRVAQIDHLVLTKFNTAWVIETKNLRAEIACNARGEWEARYAGAAARSIASPTEQAKRHVRVLDDWLQANGVRGFGRVRPLVLVGATTRVMARDTGDPDPVPVVRSDLFARWWRENHGTTLRVLLGIARRAGERSLADVGAKLVEAHTPAKMDWPRRFGLSGSEPPTRPDQATDDKIVTPFGPVYLKQVSDGRFALRHGDDEQLSGHVRTAATGFGQWNPKFRNWLVAPERVPVLVERLRLGKSS